jgi:hypothetical protein
LIQCPQNIKYKPVGGFEALASHLNKKMALKRQRKLCAVILQQGLFCWAEMEGQYDKSNRKEDERGNNQTGEQSNPEKRQAYHSRRGGETDTRIEGWQTAEGLVPDFFQAIRRYPATLFLYKIRTNHVN